MEETLTTHVNVGFGFDAFFAVVSHHFVHADIRHVSLIDRQSTCRAFRVNACLLIRFDFVIVEVPREDKYFVDQRSEKETNQVSFGLGTPSHSTVRVPLDPWMISRSFNWLENFNGAVTLTFDVESTLPTLFFTDNV